jgi:hypothetical protein
MDLTRNGAGRTPDHQQFDFRAGGLEGQTDTIQTGVPNHGSVHARSLPQERRRECLRHSVFDFGFAALNTIESGLHQTHMARSTGHTYHRSAARPHPSPAIGGT